MECDVLPFNFPGNFSSLAVISGVTTVYHPLHIFPGPRGRGQLAHENDQLLLNREKVFVTKSSSAVARAIPSAAFKFVHHAIGFHARMALGNAPIVHQSRSSLIAGLSNDAHLLSMAWKCFHEPACRYR